MKSNLQLENTFWQKTEQYLSGHLSLNDYKDWLYPHTWDLENSNFSDIVNEVKLKLGEDILEIYFKENLNRILRDRQHGLKN